MFFQSQVFPTEKGQKKPDFVWLFLISKKKPKVFKKSQDLKIWLQKSQIGNPDRNRNVGVSASAVPM